MTFASDTTTINGRSWTNEWTAATRTVSYHSPAGRTGSMIVDVRGMPLSMQAPTLTSVTYTYGTAGRVSRVQQGSRSVALTYDGRGRVASVTDPLSRTLTYTYDEADRPLTQQFADGRVVTFTYDMGGNVTSIAPPSRPAHAFHYTPDALVDRYTPPAVPNGGVTTYSYNNDHQLKIITRADSQMIALDYDTAGRIAKVITSSPTLDYGYDAAGRLASVTNSNGPSLSYAYDGSLLTRQTWTGEVSGSVGFTYDNDLRVTSENGIAFGYDDDGLLTSGGALTLQRDTQTGLVTGTTLASISDAWTYNTFGEPMTHAVSIAGSEALREVYTRDDAGRITQIAESVSGATSTTAYSYDSAGRLAAVTRDSQPAASYGYDANGNRSGGTYDDQDRLLTLGGTTYTYTKNGELATKSDTSGVTEYKYDPFGNLQTVLLPDGKRIDYVLDAQSRRVGKKVNGTLVAGWLYADQTRIVAETDGAGVVTKRFVYATRANAPDYMLFNGVTYRFVADHLGSPRYILEASAGTLVESLVYDEFGNVLSDSNPGFQPLGFAGGLYDRDSGLVHFGARDYDARAGRWTVKDPIGFNGGSTGLYIYVNGDPINYVDPTGLDQITSDPHALAEMANLMRRALMDAGFNEYSALLHVSPSNGQRYCFYLGSSKAGSSNTTRVPRMSPSVFPVYVHTHPRGKTVFANDDGDRKAANQMGIPLYVLSQSGIHKFVPDGKGGGTETTELNNADYVNQYGTNWFDFSDSDNCKCGTGQK
jgi:RHS repeat-associated protein